MDQDPLATPIPADPIAPETADGSTALRMRSVWSSTLARYDALRSSRTSAPWAYLVVATTYLLGFGLGTWWAVEYLVSPSFRTSLESSTDGITASDILVTSMKLIAIIIAVAMLSIEAPGWWRPASTERRWRTEAVVFGMTLMILILSIVMSTSLLQMPAYPSGSGDAEAWSSALSSLLAGPTEEIIVLVTPLVFLRAARWPWWAVITAAVVLRLLFHVYYGPSAIGLLIWILGVIVIYVRTQAFIGLTVAHSWFDLAVTAQTYWSDTVGQLMMILPIVAIAVTAPWWVRSLLKDLRRTPAALGQTQ